MLPRLFRLYGAFVGAGLPALVAACALGLGAPVAAHHAFSAKCDSQKPVELHGVVTKVQRT